MHYGFYELILYFFLYSFLGVVRGDRLRGGAA